MTDSLLASYDAVPYDSRPVGASEIGSLEAIALLHGVAAVPADRARVLELGSASGGNLIPMAYRYPNATFVGIDLVPSQVAIGQAEVEALGLRNITLSAMSIADITDDFGMFDYILCHGVYSWVPKEVQDAILRVSSRNLSPGGLAYISYNTMPGWHVRGMVREMVMYNDDHTLPPRERVARARAFVQSLANQGGGKTTPHRLVLVEEAANLEQSDDSYLLHEQLEPFNFPVYFSEFVDRAASVGLRYIGEAKIADSATMPSEWATNAAGGDPIRAQQYADFVSGRTFRRSLLCHADVASSPEPRADAIRSLHVTLRAEPAEPDEADRAKGGDVETFALPMGPRITTNNPLVLAAFHVLLRVAPESLAFNELLQRVNDRLSAAESPSDAPVGDREAPLAQVMLQCAAGGFVDLHRYPSPCTRTASERPLASAIARLKATARNDVPNLRHAMAAVSDVERTILCDLDGTRDRMTIAERLVDRVRQGELAFNGDLPPASEIAAFVDETLAHLGAVALLEA